LKDACGICERWRAGYEAFAELRAVQINIEYHALKLVNPLYSALQI